MAKKNRKITTAGKTAASKSGSAAKRGSQNPKAESKGGSPTPTPKRGKGLKKGSALRTRDEYLKDGVEKAEHKGDKLYYRVVYTVEINGLNEAAVVKRTTKKGRHLKERSSEKFHEEIFIEDNEGKAIKIGDKFVRSVQDDIGQVDVDYIMKRCKHYPDTAEKLRKFKSRKK